MSDLLILDIILSSGGIRQPHTLYPPPTGRRSRGSWMRSHLRRTEEGLLGLLPVEVAPRRERGGLQAEALHSTTVCHPCGHISALLTEPDDIDAPSLLLSPASWKHGCTNGPSSRPVTRESVSSAKYATGVSPVSPCSFKAAPTHLHLSEIATHAPQKPAGVPLLAV